MPIVELLGLAPKVLDIRDCCFIVSRVFPLSWISRLIGAYTISLNFIIVFLFKDLLDMCVLLKLCAVVPADGEM